MFSGVLRQPGTRADIPRFLVQTNSDEPLNGRKCSRSGQTHFPEFISIAQKSLVISAGCRLSYTL